ncbi:MAG TPA: MDR family MFS transporter [Hyphomicrobiales bacterium]|nr:MDR family MFS transporter [Hyphomicrobiales bacterium]
MSPPPAADAATAVPPEPVTHREILVVYLGFMVVMGLAALDQSIVATALPRIVAQLGGAEHLSWIVTAYVLTSTATMPLYGKLSDLYGRKPLVYVSIIIFLVGSALSGLSQSMLQLIIFRAIQGIGAGGLMPLSQITISDLVPPRERGRYQGAIPVVFAVCSVAGPIIGGVITDLLSWHWIFYINLPLGLIGLFIIGVALRRPQRTVRRAIDYAGAALLAGATTALLLVMTLGGTQYPWTSPEMLGLEGATVLLTGLFILREQVAPEPMLPLLLFRNRTFVLGCTVLSLMFVGMQGASVFYPLFFQVVMGVAPSDSGVLIAPLTVGLVISTRLNGKFLLATGRYKPPQLLGTGLGTIAFATLTWGAASGYGLWVIEPALFMVGVGMGLVMPNMTIAVQNAVDYAHMGVATATMSFFRSLGAVIGVAGSGAIMNARLESLVASSGLPHTVDPHTLLEGGVQAVNALGPGMHDLVISLYRQALSWSFSGGIFTAAIGFGLIMLIPEIELRSGTPSSPGGTTPPPPAPPTGRREREPVPQPAE